MKKFFALLVVLGGAVLVSSCAMSISITDCFNDAVTQPIENLPEWKAPYTGGGRID